MAVSETGLRGMKKKSLTNRAKMANKILVDARLFQKVCLLIEEEEHPSPDLISEMSSLCEACVLHKIILVEPHKAICEVEFSHTNHKPHEDVYEMHLAGENTIWQESELADVLQNNNVIDWDGASVFQETYERDLLKAKEKLHRCRELLPDLNEVLEETGDYELVEMLSDQRLELLSFPRRTDQTASDLGLSLLGSTEDTKSALQRRQHEDIRFYLYERLAELHQVKVQKLISLMGIRQAYIPPILSIILDRSCAPWDIPTHLMELRDELATFRDQCSKLQKDLITAERLGQQLNIMEELDRLQIALTHEINKEHTRFVYQAWDILKGGTPASITTKLIDKLIEKDIHSQICHRWQGFFDIWKASLDVSHYGHLVENVFGISDFSYKKQEMKNNRQPITSLEKSLRTRRIE